MQIDRILGNVGVLYVGAYNSSTQYEYLNCVTYNGSSYVCVNQNGVTGVTPGTTNDWQLSAQKGDTGGQGIQGEQGIQGATGNGIQSIEKTSSNGLTDTYTIAFTDGSSTTFEVENGKGIVSIEKTSSEGNVDTYTITYNDDTTSTFTVTNGQVTNEELQQALAQERVISDGKYARALKTPVTDVKSTQIYAENDVVDDLVINGVELTQVVTENSPSLDNPSEVQVASEQNISIRGNNMCKEYINSTNKARYQPALYIKADLKPSTKYTISFLTPDFDATYYRNEDLTSSWISFTNNGNRVKFSFTTNSDISKAYYSPLNAYSILKNNQVQSEKANFSEIMLVEGNTDLPYEPYYGTNITIPLVNSAIGQYADTIDRENNVQNKVIQELILTGDEDWSREDTSVGTRFFKPLQNSIISNTDNPYALCTHFKLSYSDGTYNVVGNLFAIYNVGSTNRISFGSFTDMSTVEEWKAKLKELYDAGTPVKVYYVAENPTTNPLSEEVQTALSNFKLYQDLNNVAIDGGSMSFIYNKSLSKTIEEMQDEIQSKDTLIQNLTTRVEALEKAQIDNVTEDLGSN